MANILTVDIVAGKKPRPDTGKRIEPETGNKLHGFPGWQYKEGRITADVPRGFGVVVTANGARSYVLNYELRGKQRRYTLGRCKDGQPDGLRAGDKPMVTLTEAIGAANDLRKLITGGIDPMRVEAPPADGDWGEDGDPATVRGAYNRWLKNPDHKGKPMKHPRSVFNRHILPVFGQRAYRDVRRSEIAALYDKIAEKSGPVAANRTITYMSALLNWCEGREDDWQAPRLRKLRSKERERDRVLSDDELRQLWPVFEKPGNVGQLARLLLLTACRLSEIGEAVWPEIDLETAATLTIPASRYKTEIKHVVPLSAEAIAILRAIPRRNSTDRVFTTWSYNRVKRLIDRDVEIAERWTFHDLRRTAKTLMARAGVLPHISERVLGHAQGKIEGTYDQHDYLAEKREAVDTLAWAIDRILAGLPVVKREPAAQAA